MKRLNFYSFSKAVIPGRDPQTLDKLPYWILLFKTPALAAAYQSRLRWYHKNAEWNLPVNLLQGTQIPPRGTALPQRRSLTPPVGYVDPRTGEDVWKRLHEYSILQPLQEYNATALLPEFPRSVTYAISRHERWQGSGGHQTWTVLIRVPGYQVEKDQILKFLEEDGKARDRPWGIAFEQSVDGSTNDRTEDAPQPAVFQEMVCGRGREISNGDIFGVRFTSEGEGMRLWRTWHRMPFPGLQIDADVSGLQAPMMHVELTW
jgi:hypothetical protein